MQMLKPSNFAQLIVIYFTIQEYPILNFRKVFHYAEKDKILPCLQGHVAIIGKIPAPPGAA
jgi:hypothetical protein